MHVVESEDKRSARINMIAHLLSTIPYHDVQRLPLELPRRPPSKGYERTRGRCRPRCRTTRHVSGPRSSGETTAHA